MASIGSASLTIVPKFDNLGASVNKALGGLDTSAAGKAGGKKYSSSFETAASGGLVKTGALMGVFSKVTETALGAVTNSIGSAISRLDTLNTYPRVMQSLGYSAEEAQASITLMSDHLTGLPTALNDMVGTVQGLVAVTGDLGTATDAGLALNDMLLSGGASTQATASAMEQFRQILAKGKPDMQEWNTLTQAMPGQMQQLAESMLGTGHNARDLYTALGGGGGKKAKATITLDQLLEQMIKLDKEGGQGITAFSQTAKEATGGIQSSMDNMRTAIARGVASIFDAIGSDTIKDTLGGVGKAFENVLKLGGEGIKAVKPIVSDLVESASGAAPVLLGVAGALTAVTVANKGLAAVSTLSLQSFIPMQGAAKGVSETLLTLATRFKDGGKAQNALLSAASKFGGSYGGLIGAGAMLGVAGIGALVGILIKAKEKQDLYTKATQGLNEAIEASAKPVRSASDAYSSLSSTATKTAESVRSAREAYEESINKSAELTDTITSRNSTMQSSVGLLQAYQETINKYANQTGLDARAQEELKLAVQKVNEQCGTQYKVVDAANGVIADQNGKILENTNAINENIEAKKKSLQLEVLQQNYSDLYDKQAEDTQKVKEAEEALIAARAELDKYPDSNSEGWEEAQLRVEACEQALNLANDQLDRSTEAANKAGEQLAFAGSEAGEMAAKIRELDPSCAEGVLETGTTIDDFAKRLEEAGISSENFSKITSDQFNALVEQSNGDINQLIALIAAWNGTPIEKKETKVEVKGTQELTDANGKVYVWNGKDLIDKDANIAVMGAVELTDANGQAMVWTGIDLKPKNATINVKEGGLGGALTNLKAFNNLPSTITKYAKVKVTGTSGLNLGMGARPLYNYTGQAAGGFRPHAEGAIFSKSGAIVTQATILNDVVGEAGSEAIVPLDNRRYAQPFVDMIAEGINEQRQTGSTYVTIHMSVNADQGAKKIVREIGREIKLHGLMR